MGYQCETCEYFERDAIGNPVLKCDPFSNIKEEACLQKHQLVHLDKLAQSYRATVEMYRRLAPLQEKMMRHLEREIDDAEQADSWKQETEFDSNQDDDESDDPFKI